MFSKPQTKREAASVEIVPPRKLMAASLVAEGVTLRGDVTSEGDLHLDGIVEGDLKVGRLIIGESGVVTGLVQAESVEVHGRVSGAISARQVRLWATARVDGDISHAQLSIDAGAHFDGRSLVFAAVAAEVIEPAAALAVLAAE